jgi:hypothetical protein
MALPLAALLPIAGAGLGAISGYKQSGGDIGAAALSSGLGALSLGGLGAPLKALGGRMAGTALGARLAPEAYKAQQALGALAGGAGIAGARQAASAASLANPIVQQMAGSGALAKGVVGLGALGAAATLPGMAAGLAANVAGPTRQLGGAAGQTAIGLAGQQPYTPSYMTPGAAYYQTDQFGNIAPYGASPTDVYGPSGMARRAELVEMAKAQAEAMKRTGDVQFQILEEGEKRNLARQMAAQGIRQNIATQAALVQGAQQAARDIGAEGMRGISTGLANRMQYT